jgi:hypothetical protein
MSGERPAVRGVPHAVRLSKGTRIDGYVDGVDEEILLRMESEGHTRISAIRLALRTYWMGRELDAAADAAGDPDPDPAGSY